MALVLPNVPADILNALAGDAAPRLATVTAADSAVPIVYGRQAIGAYIFAVGQIGGDLILGCAWCLGEIEAIESYTINGQDPDASVTATHYTGTSSQTADATLSAAISGYTDTCVANINGTDIGLAYTVLRIPQAATTGFPRVEGIVKGRKLYDPRENLLLRSEEIDNASWSYSHVSVSANVIAAPDGTTTADKIVEDTGVNIRYFLQSVNGLSDYQLITASIYAKAGERISIIAQMVRKDSTYATANFNLNTMAITQLNGVFDYGIEDVGNGWRRCHVTFGVGAGGIVPRFLWYLNVYNTYTGDGASGLYAWGGQVNMASLLLAGEEFGNALWTNHTVTFTADALANPINGSMTAEIVATAGGYFQQNPAITAGKIYTVSLYVKQNTGGATFSCRLQKADATEALTYDVSLTAGTITLRSAVNATAISAGIKNMGSGWFRVWITGSLNTSTTGGLYVDGHSVGQAFWGAKMRAGTYDDHDVVPSYAKTTTATLAPITQYSTNPALAERDFIASTIYGQGLTIDDNGVIDAAEACDSLLSDSSKRREINLVIDKPAPCAQWADALRTYAGCFLLRSGGNIKLVPNRPASSVASLTDSDVIKGSLKLAERGRRPTVMRVMYTDTSATPWRTLPAIAYADGVVAGTTPRREELVQLPGIITYAQAYREAVERLNTATLTDLDAVFQVFDEGLAYEEGDVIDLTHSIGLSAKTLRILAMERAAIGRWQITTAEYDGSVYSDSVAANLGNNSTLPSPSSIAVPTGVTCASGSAHLLALADGTIISRMLVTATPPDDIFFEALEVDYQKSDDSTASHAPDGYDSTYCSPVEDGATYAVSVRARNSFGKVSAWVTTNHVIVGKSEAPPPAQSFLISTDADGTRRFTWQPPASPPLDLDGARISYAVGTGHTIADMTAMHDGLLYSSPYESNQLAAGTYSFGIEYFDTSGNVSTAVYIEATIGDPRLAGALVIQQSHLDSWPGTQTNCFLDATSGWLLAHDNKTWGDLTTDTVTWATWSQFTRDPKTLTYTGEIVDAGVVTKFNPLLSAEYLGTPTLEIRTSDDNVTWSGWAAPAGQITTRYVQARATIAPISAGLTALKTMTLILDAAPVTEDINDLDTSTLTGSYRLAAGDIRLPITKTYAAINNVLMALQNVGAGWTWEVIDKDTSVGPRVKIYNGSGTLADATIDANVRGV